MAKTKNKILIVSGCDEKQECFGQLAFQNFSEYADKWGYDFKSYTGDNFYFTKGLGANTHEMQTEKQSEQTIAFNWNKVGVVGSNLYDYDYVLWIDADAFIVNFTKSIEEIFDLDNTDKEFFLAPDAVSLNAGVFLVKNCPNMHSLFKEWTYMGFKKDEYYSDDFSSGRSICNFEQAAWCELYYKNWNNLMVSTQIMSSTKINSHLQKEFWRAPHCDYLQYKKGESFILHLAGVPNQDRIYFWHSFIKSEVITGE